MAGLIGETESFQKKNTTPKSLSIAASLMEKGANQQEIIRFLYKTHPLHILKLWGRTMAKINWVEKIKLVWSTLNIEDFVQSRSNPNDLPFILEKLEENYNEGRIFMAIYNDTPQSSIALIKISSPDLIKKIYPNLNGNLRGNILEIKIQNSNLSETSKEIIEKIEKLNL